MEYVWLLSILIISYTLYKYFSRNVNFWKNLGVKGPKPLPLFGNLLELFGTSLTELELKRSQKYGKIYGFFELTQPILSISDIELIKKITMKDFSCFTNKRSLSPEHPILKKNIVDLHDEEWKRVRNICIPAFTSNKIRQMFPMVNQVVDNAVEYFNEMAEKQEMIHLQKAFSAFTMDVIALTLFGVEVNSFKDPDGDYSRYASSLFRISSSKILFGIILPDFLTRFLNLGLFESKSVDYFKKLVKFVINEKKTKDSKQRTFLELLLKAELNDEKSMKKFSAEGLGSESDFTVNHGNRQLNEEEILAQCLILMIAGTDTTTLALEYFTYTMATKTEIQQKLYEKLKDYFDNEEYGFESLMSLEYLDAVTNETLRRYSPIIQFDRITGCDYELGNTGITIPKGTIINLPFHAIHHDPDYWQEPFEFKPERFLPENKDKLVPFAFAPFGYGPRICLGMKLAVAVMKTLFAKLVYNFEIVKTEKTPEEPIYDGKKMANHCKPIYVKLKKR